MNCPHCGADTAVLDSRHTADNLMRRRRECTGCGHRFTTYESTIAPHVVLKHRAKSNERKRRWLANNPERKAKYDEYNRMYQQARREAAETGETIAQVRKRWGCD